jgi:hypothetical protein
MFFPVMIQILFLDAEYFDRMEEEKEPAWKKKEWNCL